MTLSLSPEAQAAIERLELERRNQAGLKSLQSLRRAQQYRRRLAAARQAALEADAAGRAAERHVTPRQAWHTGHTDHVRRLIQERPGITTRGLVDATQLTIGQVTNIVDRLKTQRHIHRTLTTDGGGRRAQWYPGPPE